MWDLHLLIQILVSDVSLSSRYSILQILYTSFLKEPDHQVHIVSSFSPFEPFASSVIPF